MSEPYGIKKLRRAFDISQEPRTGMHVGLPHVTIEASLVAHALAAYDALTARVAELQSWIADACEDADVFKHEGRPVLVSMGPWSPDFHARGLRLSGADDGKHSTKETT